MNKYRLVILVVILMLISLFFLAVPASAYEPDCRVEPCFLMVEPFFLDERHPNGTQELTTEPGTPFMIGVTMFKQVGSDDLPVDIYIPHYQGLTPDFAHTYEENFVGDGEWVCCYGGYMAYGGTQTDRVATVALTFTATLDGEFVFPIIISSTIPITYAYITSPVITLTLINPVSYQPRIDNVTPRGVLPGETITISGVNFLAPDPSIDCFDLKVWFMDVESGWRWWNDSCMIAWSDSAISLGLPEILEENHRYEIWITKGVVQSNRAVITTGPIWQFYLPLVLK